MEVAERDKYSTINFEETELRLGLPEAHGNTCSANSTFTAAGKRGFCETEASSFGHEDSDEEEEVDLKLNLSNSKVETNHEPTTDHNKSTTKEIASAAPCVNAPNSPSNHPAKAQVVGWPPVRSFRKNIVAAQKNNAGEGEKGRAAFVKVSMDGAPYLRKVDLKLYRSYQELSDALAKMFSSFTIGNCGSQGTVKDFMNESKLIDLLNGSEYVPTYEDKDGDWMLVGDVPWEMFVESCKRLRIMKGSEAIGLAPRAVEKCKSRC